MRPNPHHDRRLAGVVAPPEQRRAPIWDRPIPSAGRAPLVWLLGAHGGAGVTTLERLLAPAADCERKWPAVLDRESPYVAVVARETISGLGHAHDRLRQHHAGFGGPSEVIGLITVAARPGRMAPEIRRYRDIVSALTPHIWRVQWQEEWTLVEPHQLPEWRPGDSAPARRRVDPLDEVPAEIRELGDHVVAAVRESIANARSSTARPSITPDRSSDQ